MGTVEGLSVGVSVEGSSVGADVGVYEGLTERTTEGSREGLVEGTCSKNTMINQCDYQHQEKRGRVINTIVGADEGKAVGLRVTLT